MKHPFCLSSLVLWIVCQLAQAAGPTVNVSVGADQPGTPISPTMWGVFFEDINFGADGGLYAELVKNRSFEFPDGLMGWRRIEGQGASGSVSVSNHEPVNTANPHYLRLNLTAASGQFGIANEGFRGMGVRAGAKYRFSMFARSPEGDRIRLHVRLVGSNDNVLAQQELSGFARAWEKKTATLRATATDPKARLDLILSNPGTLDLDAVSLVPEETWKKRPNGLRADLVQMLADLKPGFMRFPGGCIVEGHKLDTRYQWKTTIGDRDDRHLIINRWNDEFKHRPAPDYYQSFGLGFFEFFQLCEDIGAQPLPILNCGMACQFNSGELAPDNQIDSYIQDALDLIEFANGPASSPWGRKRAEMGHPQPFHLRYLGVGNEQWGPAYIERYTKFRQVLKASYPEILLVSSAGPSPDDERFQFAWPKLRELRADIVDEHCYARPDWFLNNTTRYDKYDRSGPKVFMGEYAAQSVKTVSPDNRNTWECALAEAAYMIGLERNADVVVMASYAPLFSHVDAWQWTPDLIWFDNLRTVATPNYYVQQLFSRNRGDMLLPAKIIDSSSTPGQQPRFYASAARDEKSREIILKVVNASPNTVSAQLTLAGMRRVKANGKAFVLSGPSLEAVNTLEQPRQVAPQESSLTGVAPSFQHDFPPESLTVIRISAK
jgi:alpha-N-arabinofuranosidase